jgi:hypothetical protein
MSVKILASASLALVSACSFHENVGGSAVAYNKSYETSNNGTILLNILRGKERMPMHFSTLSKVSGKLNYQVQSQLSFPFGQNLSASTGWFNNFTSFFNLQGGPNYDISTENTKEFMQGILSPQGPDKLYFYWSQGWPKSLLLHMFVDRIEEKCGAEPPRSYSNGPFGSDHDLTRPDGYAGFKKLIEEWVVARGITMTSEERIVAIGPRLLRHEAARIEAVAQARKEGLLLVCWTKDAAGADVECTDKTPEGQKYFRLGRSTTKYALKFTRELSTQIEQDGRVRRDQAGQNILRFSIQTKGVRGEQVRKCEYQMSLRSVQGMIYYLGEIARGQERLGFKDDIVKLREWEGGTSESLFVLRSGIDLGEKVVAAETYQGKPYYVPLAAGTRSAQAFALIDQLFGLSRKAETLQQTPTVRIIN